MKREREPVEDERHDARRYDGDANKRARSTYETAHTHRPYIQHNNNHDNRKVSSGTLPPREGSSASGRNAERVEVRTLKTERETDPHRLAQRQKQIDYGKNTLGYDRYCAEVPRHQRRKGEHPRTPDKTLKISKKHFDSMVRNWRQGLHKYDPPELVERLHAAEKQATEQEAAAATGELAQKTGDAEIDPELAELDPSNHSTAPSIFDTFHDDDESVAVDYGDGEDDDDDDLL